VSWALSGQLTLLGDPIDARFLEFHHAHPEVYRELVRLARRWKAAGHARIGMKMLFEVLRWERGLAGVRDDRGFRLNNDFTSRYARLIQANEPDLVGFFETRALVDERVS
jgi:hypothetical protein